MAITDFMIEICIADGINILGNDYLFYIFNDVLFMLMFI